VITSAGVTSGTWWRKTRHGPGFLSRRPNEHDFPCSVPASRWSAPEAPGVGIHGRWRVRDESGHAMVDAISICLILKHFLVSNRVYNATGALPLVNVKRQRTMQGSPRPSASNASSRSTPSRDSTASSTKTCLSPAHVHVFSKSSRCGKAGGVPIDDVESKFRFGRYIERKAGIKIFRPPRH